jgi:hypothetical protein
MSKGRESEHHFWGFPQVILSWSQSVPNSLRMRGKYLNVFGECAERIYASMEKTQKGSWHIL